MTQDEFEQWLQRYGSAWINGAPDEVITLFSPDARYFETPFDEPMIGRDAIRHYWTEGAKNSQREISFTAEVIGFREAEGVAYWQASFERIPSGIKVRLDGILKASFDSEGFCEEFREWWHRQES